MSLVFSVVLGVVLTFFMLWLSPHLACIMQIPADSVVQTVDYMTYCSWGILFIVGYNILSAIFRGFGNSTAPLIFVGIACVINIIADLLLVAHFGLGPKGAAIATVISQAISMILGIFYLMYGGFGFKFRLPNFKIKWQLAGEFFKIGIPIGIQGILINLSFLFIMAIVNSMGGDSSAPAAGYGIVNRLNGFFMLPAISFSMAMAAITAQNIGANKPVRALKTLQLAIIYTFCAGVVFLIFMQCCPGFAVSLFIDTASPDAQEVIANGILYARSFSWDYILVPVVFCTNGFFNGCGRTFFSMSNNLTGTFLIRVPVSYWVSTLENGNLFHVGMAAPLASFCAGAVALIYLWSGRWRNTKFKVVD